MAQGRMQISDSVYSGFGANIHTVPDHLASIADMQFCTLNEASVIIQNRQPQPE